MGNNHEDEAVSRQLDALLSALGRRLLRTSPASALQPSTDPPPMQDLDLLATKIAEHVSLRLERPAVPFDVQLWDINAIGEWMGLSADTVSKNVVTRPAFPEPVQPTASRHAQKRWFAGEVIAWARQSRSALPKGRGRPRYPV